MDPRRNQPEKGEHNKDTDQRTMRAMTCLVAAILLTMAVSPASFLRRAPAADKSVAKNIIVMISDGWGYNHIDASSYYQYGPAARQIYNRFPFRYAMSTYPALYEAKLVTGGAMIQSPPGVISTM